MLVGDFSIVAEAPAPDYHVVKSGALRVHVATAGTSAPHCFTQRGPRATSKNCALSRRKSA
jgi:hypothetical protein